MLISTVIFITIFTSAYSAETYDCRNGTVYLKINEIAFFETQNYPTYLTEEELQQCDLFFVFANETHKKIKMIYAFFQFPLDYNNFPTVFNEIDVSSYMVKNGFSYGSFAEQGFVAFIDDFYSCPMELLSKNKPFEIVDESQILHISSSFRFPQIIQQLCHWRFAAPEGYGFKIVIQKFNISKTAIFKIENSTDFITNERSVKTNYPYYNSDTFIEITLTKGDAIFNTDMEFQAYISIIKNSQEKINISCDVTSNHDVTDIIYWGNINDIKGYENNVRCFYDLIIPPNSAVSVYMYGKLEDDVDYVKYYEIHHESESTAIEYTNKNRFIIDNYKNDFNKSIIFEFVSDGSVQSNGFRLSFEIYDCKCTDKIAKCNDCTRGPPCDSDKNFLMEQPFFGELDYYCGNLNCNITIEKCSTPFTYIKFFTSSSVSPYDVFRLISNNHIAFEIIDWGHDGYFTYLNSSAENILQAITFHSPKYNTLWFYVEEFEAQSVSTLIFFENNVTATIDTSLNPFTIVETELRNQHFEVFCPNPERIALYTDASLTTPIKYCFFGDHPNICIIKSNKFAVHNSLNDERTYLAIKLLENGNNCVFNETTYFTNTHANFSIANLSNKNGPCHITLFVNDIYFTTNLWTTSKKETVRVYAGIDQTRLFVEFNYKTAKKWKRIHLNSAVYTIVIPPSTAVFITLEKGADWVTNVQIENHYFYLTATADYGCTKSAIGDNDDEVTVSFSVINPVIFTVLVFNLESPSYFYLEACKEDKNIEKAGEYFVFSNCIVRLHYYADPNTLETGALIFIQTFDETLNKRIF